MREKVKRACLRCGKQKPIVARGLCGGCYDAARKSGELDKLYPARGRGGRKAAGAAVRSEAIAAPVEKEMAVPEAPPAVEQKPAPAPAPAQKDDAIGAFKVVQLDFSQHADLLDQLRDQAAKEIRDLSGQIMWELKRAMAIPLLPPCAYFPKRDSTAASVAVRREGISSAG